MVLKSETGTSSLYGKVLVFTATMNVRKISQPQNKPKVKIIRRLEKIKVVSPSQPNALSLKLMRFNVEFHSIIMKRYSLTQIEAIENIPLLATFITVSEFVVELC